MVLQYNCNAENSEKFIASSSGVKYILVLKMYMVEQYNCNTDNLYGTPI